MHSVRSESAADNVAVGIGGSDDGNDADLHHQEASLSDTAGQGALAQGHNTGEEGGRLHKKAANELGPRISSGGTQYHYISDLAKTKQVGTPKKVSGTGAPKKVSGAGTPKQVSSTQRSELPTGTPKQVSGDHTRLGVQTPARSFSPEPLLCRTPPFSARDRTLSSLPITPQQAEAAATNVQPLPSRQSKRHVKTRSSLRFKSRADD